MATVFENHQWEVTDYGVESKRPAPTYNFEAARLLETADHGHGPMYDWPVHMAEKTWVDIEAFIEAFEQALAIHKGKYDGKADPEMMSESLRVARRYARER